MGDTQTATRVDGHRLDPAPRFEGRETYGVTASRVIHILRWGEAMSDWMYGAIYFGIWVGLVVSLVERIRGGRT